MSLRIHVNQYNRYDDLLQTDYLEEFESGKSHATRDERRLYYTGDRFDIEPSYIEGKCHVLHFDQISNLSAFKDSGNDNFWVKDKIIDSYIEDEERTIHDLVYFPAADLQHSTESMREYDAAKQKLKNFQSHSRPLRALEIFAGCGGLSVGLEASGAVETEYAIEFSEAAARTLARNRPHTKVYNQDANEMLKRAFLEDQGQQLEQVLDFQGNPVPAMPKKGVVEVSTPTTSSIY